MGREAVNLLGGLLRGRTVLAASLGEWTTLGVGGPADALVSPADREDLARLLSFLRDHECPWFVMGNGSNLVVRDAGIRGAVLNLEAGFRGLVRCEETPDGPTVRAEAGVGLRQLLRWSVDEAIAGFEFLSGIPGTVGGAVAMNAGSWGSEIGDRILEVELLDREGRTVRLSSGDLRLGYRKSELPQGTVIVSARLQGERSTAEAVKRKARGFYLQKRDQQPLRERSAGCVFRNPPGESAGRLIDECGLKGLRVGGAEVCRVHANFIVNAGDATAADFVALMEMIQERVWAKFKARLEAEVVMVGEWGKGKLRIRE